MKFCSNPFNFYETKSNGDVFPCCPSWVNNNTLGNINTDGNMMDIFNSERAQEFRKSIHDGSFRYCNHDLCPKLSSNSLPNREDIKDSRLKDIIDNNRTKIDHPVFINFSHDRSCNLQCPSCRIKKVMITSGVQFDKLKRLQDSILDDLSKIDFNTPYVISITGSGDPFASKLFRDFLLSIDGKQHPFLRIQLQTNGVLFTPEMWERMHKIQNNIEYVLVSVDAATEDTYNKVRVNGDWNALLNNIEFLGRLRKDNKIKTLRLDYVVQKYNYREMKQFIGMFLSDPYYVDAVNFSIVTDWNTWTNEEFLDMAVWHEDNPLHQDFVESLKDPVFRKDKVWIGNLAKWVNK